MRILCVAGARPNFVKIAPLLRAFAEARTTRGAALETRLVDTGQHYDEVMSAALYRDLEIAPPDYSLHVGSGSHATQTAAAMTGFESVVMRERPDLVLVVGDVNSTLACALVAAKLGIALAHVEAGLRSFDRRMPEEINRVLTDCLADFLFTTERAANHNLAREGVPEEKVFLVGNVMVDSLRWAQQRATGSPQWAQLAGAIGAANGFALATLHRPENVDSPAQLQRLIETFAALAGDLAVLFPVHPRTRVRLREFGLLAGFEAAEPPAGTGHLRRGQLHLVEPLSYRDCIAAIASARVVLSDSGGIQEETTCLGVPCITLRATTERPITADRGTSVVAGTDPATVLRFARAALSAGRPSISLPELWDGHSAERIVDILIARGPRA